MAIKTFGYILLSCLCIFHVDCISTYRTLQIGYMCGKHIGIACENGVEMEERAGTLELFLDERLRAAECNVTLSLDNCQSSSAIYFNYVQAYPMGNASIDIYEVDGQKENLVKAISTGVTISPFSTAQFLSSYSYNPELKFVINAKKSWGDIPQLLFHYVVLRKAKLSEANATFCRALNGYMHEELLCDSQVKKRVNCPMDYTASVDLNPVVLGTQKCDKPVKGPPKDRAQKNVTEVSYEIFHGSYNEYHFGNVRNSTLELPCPTDELPLSQFGGYIYAAALYGNFVLNLTISHGCPKTTAIYLRITKFTFEKNGAIQIYEIEENGKQTNVKTLTGSTGYSDSKAHVISQFTKKPFFLVNITASTWEKYKTWVTLWLSYTVLRKEPGADQALCEPLDGYMSDLEICQVCPIEYTKNLGTNDISVPKPCDRKHREWFEDRSLREDVNKRPKINALDDGVSIEFKQNNCKREVLFSCPTSSNYTRVHSIILREDSTCKHNITLNMTFSHPCPFDVAIYLLMY